MNCFICAFFGALLLYSQIYVCIEAGNVTVVKISCTMTDDKCNDHCFQKYGYFGRHIPRYGKELTYGVVYFRKICICHLAKHLKEYLKDNKLQWRKLWLKMIWSPKSFHEWLDRYDVPFITHKTAEDKGYLL
nr:PREDICTED: uncharacterized protein LOC109043342 [Bemisia tabaci]